MSDDILLEIACPNCRHPIDIRSQQGYQVTCEACSSEFVLQGHICPTCAAYHPEEQGFCRDCGAAMTRICRKCQTSNWSGAEYCKNCGEAMDIFQYLHVKGNADAADRLNEQMAWSRDIKKQEAIASEKRMADLMAMEEDRQEKLQQMRAAQKQQDRLMMMIGGFAVVAIVIFVIGFVLFQMLTG